jgi:hypothetical protein
MRPRKSVYLNIRITREMAKKIRQLSRVRRHQLLSDFARELFTVAIRDAEERGEFAALPSRKKPRQTPTDPAPSAPAAVESEPKVAA